MIQIPAKFDSMGRVLIPAIIRNHLNLPIETEFTLIVDNGEIKLIPMVTPSQKEVK